MSINASVLHGLYALTHQPQSQEQLFQDVEKALSAGLRLLQYRDKSPDANKRLYEAMRLKTLCDQYQARLMVNDDIALAKAVKADGVHLGRDDGAVSIARDQLGGSCIVGVSCYNELDLAQVAKAQGADYVAFGRFFPSRTKPEAVLASMELLDQWHDETIPVCTIGGVIKDNAASLIDRGADMVAVIDGLWSAQDIAAEVKAFQALFGASQ